MALSRRLRAGIVVSLTAGVLAGICCAVGWAVALLIAPALSAEPGAPSILGAFVRFGAIGTVFGAVFSASAASSPAGQPDQRIAAGRASMLACVGGPLIMLVVVPLVTGQGVLWSIALPIVSMAVLGTAAGTTLVSAARQHELGGPGDSPPTLAP